MHEFKRYSGLIGWCLLVVMVILLGTSTQHFHVGASFIDTELHQRGDDAKFVRTKMDLGNAEEVRAFPREIGEWTGFDYSTANLEAGLKADVMLMRGYSKPGLFQPVFLLLMRSSSGGSFHAPNHCYPMLGYQIEEEVTEPVYIADASWAEEDPRRAPALKKLESPYFGGTLSVKKLVVFKEAQGKIVERRVVLYFYVKDQATSSKATMVRVSALAPLSGSYDGAIEPVKGLIGEVVPRLFQPRAQEGRMLISALADRGVVGYFIILLLFSVPLGLILYSRFSARRAATSRGMRNKGDSARSHNLQGRS